MFAAGIPVHCIHVGLAAFRIISLISPTPDPDPEFTARKFVAEATAGFVLPSRASALARIAFA